MIVVLSLMANETQEGVMLMKSEFVWDFITCTIATISSSLFVLIDVLPLGIGVSRDPSIDELYVVTDESMCFRTF